MLIWEEHGTHHPDIINTKLARHGDIELYIDTYRTGCMVDIYISGVQHKHAYMQFNNEADAIRWCEAMVMTGALE